MTAEPREELISAYLDDELSADERAQVEKWLAESAECRQLLDELRAVRSSLQSLPRQRVEHDLGPAVLRRAERNVLSGNQRAANASAPVNPSSSVEPAPAGGFRQWWERGGKRRIIWPAVALAAALLIAMFDTQREPAERELAQNAPHKQNETLADRTKRDGPSRDRLSGEAKDEEAPQMSARPADQSRTEPLGQIADYDRSEPSADQKTPAQSSLKVKDSMNLIRGGAKPAAAPALTVAQPSEAPGAAGESAKGMISNRYAKKTDNYFTANEPIDLIVCDVDAAFIKEQQLERVLNSNKIPFKRLGAEARQRDVQSRSKEVQSQALGLQELYQCNAAPEQVNLVISELKRDSSQVSNVAVTNSEGASAAEQRGLKLAPNASAAKKPGATERLLYKQEAEKISEPLPVTFWLRVVDSNEPAAGKK